MTNCIAKEILKVEDFWGVKRVGYKYKNFQLQEGQPDPLCRFSTDEVCKPITGDKYSNNLSLAPCKLSLWYQTGLAQVIFFLH